MTRSVRRWSAVAATTLLALGLTACGGNSSDTSSAPAAVPQAATDAVTWLTGQLENGVLVNHQYKTNDDSTTVELAYGVRAIDPRSPALATIGKALAKDAKTYSHPGKEIYSGATAKLLSFATDTGADPTSFGGLDLVKQMDGLTAASGRIADVSKYGDYANTFGQTWAVRGLLNARSKEAPAAERFLLQQQCPAGFFRQDFSKPGAKDQGCSGKDQPSIDTTALVVVLLDDKASGDQALASAIDKAAAWLKGQQAKDGSFVLDSAPGGNGASNANSTGLAASALRLAGDDAGAAKAATWVRAHQLPSGCKGELAGEAGAIGYDAPTLVEAGRGGITAKTAYTWRLATAQAAPALLSVPASAPAADCPAS
ncbi:MAG: terpene cyclase/mutase family protein [Nocardioidaceae bacterium]|nr:terpene cyclase/mutase family protein [Nocardioidaceae bacterium]MCL2612594.1 terpene cyclase/mutase family protein [Nocardioidaceae bacterium]